MITSTHSVHQGAVRTIELGIRAGLLSLVASLGWFGLLNSAQAEGKRVAATLRDSSELGREFTEGTDRGSNASVTDPAPSKVEENIGEPTVRHIGPVTTITEVSSGLHFPARVDTGATTCSIHYEELEIEDAAEAPADNIGKRARILIKNPDGDEEWISTKIADHVTVRTTTDDEERYKVRLKLRWQDVEKHVLVTLKDREKMKYPLLVGRNFLRGDFVVDVNLDSE